MSDKIPDKILALKILVVDDSVSMRQLVRNYLGEYGIKNCDEAANGVAAREILIDRQMSNPFDLIVSDIGMPKMTGFELLTFVRKGLNDEKVRFMVLSSESEKVSILRAMQSGADSYITKPFTKQNLIEAILKLYK